MTIANEVYTPSVYLRPNGQPDRFTMWADIRPRQIKLDHETPLAWIGYPAANPNVTEPLTYPKFAWEAVPRP